MKRMKYIAIVAGLLFLFPGCEFLLGIKENSSGNVTLRFGGENARTAYTSTFIDGFSYEVEFRGPGGQTIKRDVPAGTKTITLTLSMGEWEIITKSFNTPDHYLSGTGSKTIKVASGLDPVIITMNDASPLRRGASWEDSVPIDLPTLLGMTGANILEKAVNYINANGTRNTTYDRYILTVDRDIETAPVVINGGIDMNFLNSTITLRADEPREIKLASVGNLFYLQGGSTDPVTLVLDNNITLRGRSDNNASLVMVGQFANLEMRDGSMITGNTVSSVPVEGGGVMVNSGAFTMNGGTITANQAYNTSSVTRGGGVMVDYGAFTMNGGTIAANRAKSATSNSTGGGLFLAQHNVVFIKTGGVIYGQDHAAAGNLAVDLGDAPQASGSGHAIYIDGSAYLKDTTSDANNILYAKYTASWDFDGTADGVPGALPGNW
jgi:hypothetical protein